MKSEISAYIDTLEASASARKDARIELYKAQRNPELNTDPTNAEEAFDALAILQRVIAGDKAELFATFYPGILTLGQYKTFLKFEFFMRSCLNADNAKFKQKFVDAVQN